MIIKKIIDLIEKKNVMHSKLLDKYAQSWDKEFYQKAEKYLENYISFLNSRGIDFDYAVNAYLFMVEEMIAAHFEFVTNGRYKYTTFEEVNRNVYSNADYMRKYMVGLAISQFFWENHYEIFRFFINSISKYSVGDSYLEIGSGHGMFLMEALKNSKYKNYTAMDVSAESLNLTREIIEYNHPELKNKLTFIQADIHTREIDTTYDFITMGEVLEHLETPEKALKKIFEHLKSDGRFFISTCANSPAIDHIYLFNNVDEIRDMFKKCGFIIESEAVLPINNYSEEKAVKKKVTINYCAILKKR